MSKHGLGEVGGRTNNDWGTLVLVLVFVLGALLGGLLATYVVYPSLNGEAFNTLDTLQEQNRQLNIENQTYLQCLTRNQIEPNKCPVAR